MHSSDNNSLFSSWSDAEREARDAERRLYELILSLEGRPACRSDVERTHALRERASERMAELLHGLRDEALGLRLPRGDAGPWLQYPKPDDGDTGARFSST